jgi:hypothetical protein
LNQETACRSYGAVLLHKNTKTDRRGDLFRFSKVLGQILADLAGDELHSPLVRLLQPQVFGHRKESGTTEGSGHVDCAIPEGKINRRVSDGAGHGTITLGLNEDLAERAVSFKFQCDALVGLEERTHEGSPGERPTKGCRGSREGAMPPRRFSNQTRRHAGQSPDRP